MIEYSHGNAITFGYGSGSLNEKTIGAELQFHFNHCIREPKSFRDEVQNVARLVQEKAERLQRPIYLLQSGGLDCEVMLKAFIDQNIPFVPITFRLNGFNEHELQYVKRFNDRHGLKSNFLTINPLTWIPKQQELFHRTHSASAFMLCHMKLLSRIWELGGMPVIGAGDVLLENTPTGWLVVKHEYMLPWYWHMEQQGINGVPAFFTHTSEVVLAMLREPRMKRVAESNDVNANKLLKDARQQKYAVYLDHWPDLQRRPKFTGEEFVYKQTGALQQDWAADRDLRFTDVWTSTLQEMSTNLSVVDHL